MPHAEQLHFPKNSVVISISPLGVVLYMPSIIPRKYPFLKNLYKIMGLTSVCSVSNAMLLQLDTFTTGSHVPPSPQ